MAYDIRMLIFQTKDSPVLRIIKSKKISTIVTKEPKNIVLMEVNRFEEFSPLKNKEGDNSPQEVRESLTKLYASWIKEAKIEIPTGKDGKILGFIEISPLFALDKEEFVQKAKGRVFQRVWR